MDLCTSAVLYRCVYGSVLFRILARFSAVRSSCHDGRVDNLSPEERSRQMRLIRSRDTKPELFIRRLVHGLGYRYRLHRRDLPGTPDLVFPSKRKVIFVHGCFWHGHSCRLGARVPKSRQDYWTNKIFHNVERDRTAVERLQLMGWGPLVIWECQRQNKDELTAILIQFLEK